MTEHKIKDKITLRRVRIVPSSDDAEIVRNFGIPPVTVDYREIIAELKKARAALIITIAYFEAVESVQRRSGYTDPSGGNTRDAKRFVTAGAQ